MNPIVCILISKDTKYINNWQFWFKKNQEQKH